MDTTQLLKGVLDLAVLAVVSTEDGYGYDVVRRLRSAGLDDVGVLVESFVGASAATGVDALSGSCGGRALTTIATSSRVARPSSPKIHACCPFEQQISHH